MNKKLKKSNVHYTRSDMKPQTSRTDSNVYTAELTGRLNKQSVYMKYV